MRIPQLAVVLVLVAPALAGCTGLMDAFGGTSCEATEETTPRTDVSTRREGSEWVAEATYRAAGEASDAMQAAVGVANGDVAVDDAGDRVDVTLTVSARGDSQAEARDRVRDVLVLVAVDGDRIAACAKVPEGDWSDRSADVDLSAPTRLSGQLSTANGPITFDGVEADRLQASTANGAIQGTITVASELRADTANGDIDLDLTPMGEVSLSASTANGRVDLGLPDDGRTAYRIDASTSNGEITESMDNAHLEGSETDATLVSDGSSGDDAKLSGSASTANEDVRFHPLGDGGSDGDDGLDLPP